MTEDNLELIAHSELFFLSVVKGTPVEEGWAPPPAEPRVVGSPGLTCP